MGPVPESGEEPLPDVRVNQTGYLPQAVKRATISNTAVLPLTWTLHDMTGTAVLTGSTTVYGLNAASDEHVHIADFSIYQTPGVSYTLDVSGGWYDAGDHGKYVVNGGISVALKSECHWGMSFVFWLTAVGNWDCLPNPTPHRVKFARYTIKVETQENVQ